MSNIYVLTYNNYYNRTIRKEDTLNGYLNARSYYDIQGANFNPNDGIDAQHVFNSTHKATAYDGSGDYFLVADGDEIISRWFIVESRRNTAGQWTLFLRRDVVADYLDNIRAATCFIEKGTVDYNDNAIFNSENMSFNQIKSGETLLWDRTKSGWIIGYYDKSGTTEGAMSGTVERQSFTGAIETNVQDIAQWGLYKYTNKFYGPATVNSVLIDTVYNDPYGRRYVVTDSNVIIKDTYGDTNSLIVAEPIGPASAIAMSLIGTFGSLSEVINRGKKDVSDNYTDPDWEEYAFNWDGKIVKTTDDRYYEIKVTYGTDERKCFVLNQQFVMDLDNAMDHEYVIRKQGNPYSVSAQQPTAQWTLIERNDLQLNYDITNARDTVDAPYNIFAIPYGEVTCIDTANNIVTDPNIGLDTAMSIATQHPSRVYDLQLLPYCPAQNAIIDAESPSIDLGSVSHSYIVDGDGNPHGVILSIERSTFSFAIPITPITISEPKVQIECDMHRLCSPNWNGIFEFNAAKNGGVSFFDVKCTYKPFTPFVRIAPNFARLYGNDYGDARGLILNGDFSLPTLTDQWKLYEINNKNYQQSFDRQIENMEIKQGAQRVQDIAGSIAGAVGGAASGAVLTGNAVGAVVGGVASAVGGIVDFGINEMLRNEAIDYTKDQFGYTLGNIQALPRTITRVGAYNAVNKLVPVLEYYTCTPEEKQALRDKIRYNGMTIMRIGLFGDYIRSNETYIKAQLIRIEVGEDTHVVNTIANELNKGVFI